MVTPLGPCQGVLLNEWHATLLQKFYFNHPPPQIFHPAIHSQATWAHICLWTGQRLCFDSTRSNVQWFHLALLDEGIGETASYFISHSRLPVSFLWRNLDPWQTVCGIPGWSPWQEMGGGDDSAKEAAEGSSPWEPQLWLACSNGP